MEVTTAIISAVISGFFSLIGVYLKYKLDKKGEMGCFGSLIGFVGVFVVVFFILKSCSINSFSTSKQKKNPVVEEDSPVFSTPKGSIVIPNVTLYDRFIDNLKQESVRSFFKNTCDEKVDEKVTTIQNITCEHASFMYCVECTNKNGLLATNIRNPKFFIDSKLHT